MSRVDGPEVGDIGLSPGESFLKLLLEGIEKHGDDIAMVEGDSGDSTTFSEMLKNCKSISAELSSRGVSAGDLVVLCCEQSILAYTVLFGAMFTGATVVLVPTSSAAIIHKLTSNQSVKAVFCESNYREKVFVSLQHMETRPDLVASVSIEDHNMAALLGSSKQFQPYQVKQPQQHVSILLFSSGTTGDPKGIPLSDSTVCKICMRPMPSKSYLSLSPMYWLSGLIFNLSCTVHKQLVVMSSSLNVDEIFRLTDKYQIDVWFLSIRAITQLVKSERRAQYDLSSLKLVLSGGEVLLASVGKGFVENVIGNKVKFILVLGTTEGGGLAMNPDITLVDSKNRVVSCGQPMTGAKIKVTDEEGNVVALGQEGEIWMKSLFQTSGYWNKPELTKSMYDEEGFMNTGDYGYIDLQGNLYNLGRNVDMITYKGIKTAPTAAEDILFSQPGVLEVAVVGIPDDQVGQLATAYVVKSPGSQITEEYLTDWVNSQVEDSQQLHGGVIFRDSLPRLDVGKVIKKRLREPNAT